MHFGMRGRSEHYSLKVEDFIIETNSKGRKFVAFKEGLTKTNNQGLNFKPRIIQPKMYETKEYDCPVVFFEKYISHRPFHMRESGPFYLAVIENPKSNIWYKQTKMGVNTIDNMVKRMKENSTLAVTAKKKKFTNHSLRKTGVSRMKGAGIPKSEIKNITGHASEAGLDPYDSGNEEEMYKMSSVISGKRPENTETNQGNQIDSKISTVPQISQFAPPNVFPNNQLFGLGVQSMQSSFSFGIPIPPTQNYPSCSYGNNFYQNCTVNINQNDEVKQKVKRRRRLAIISDSEDSD